MRVKPFTLPKLALALFALSPIAGQAESVSFSQAWQTVVSQNEGLAAERTKVDQAKYLQDAAWDLNLPQVSVGANYTRLDDNIEISPSDLFSSMPASGSDAGKVISQLAEQLSKLTGTDFNSLFTSQITDKDVFTSSIRAIWPIFTGGRINAAQAIAEGKTEEAKYMLAMKKQATYEDLSRFYFGVVLAEQVYKTRQEVEAGLKQHFEHAVKLQQQGQIARVERLQAEAAYDKAKVETQKSKRDLEIVQVALTKLLNASSPITPTTTLFTNEQLPNLDSFLSQTLTTYPGLHLLDAKRKQANGLIDVEKGKYYPEVYLYGNYNIYDGHSLAAELTPDWAVGVGVNIPLIDNTGRSGKLKAAHSAVSQVNHLQAQAKQDLSVLVEKTYKEANQALEEYQGLQSSLNLANENVRLREKAFSQGLSTSLDVVDAELFLASIKTQRLAASYQYITSLTRLLAISGQMSEFNQYQKYRGLEVQSK
ncbi:TolC family protein [Photobacterium damselae]|uniref:Outer membrane protein n=2 Tax=Photobacterium damselae TaxID=38293 RepID=D0Z310_PHODD|nr:TolC family protein [Photobacterium damselae]EEZ39791.1 outer membrane protein [Photobacterium damselae subsp. damselae CIP 102761]PSW84100.1 TolC family protein [Photobacterium damselae]SPY43895.1 type I secretion outer membrane protein, TolC family [Photobacterium damselae]